MGVLRAQRLVQRDEEKLELTLDLTSFEIGQLRLYPARYLALSGRQKNTITRNRSFRHRDRHIAAAMHSAVSEELH